MHANNSHRTREAMPLSARGARETIVLADYSPHAGWAMHSYDEEADDTDAEARSARLAGADVAAASGAHHAAFYVSRPPPPPLSLFPGRPRLEAALLEAETMGEFVWRSMTPARRGTPHAPLFTALNAAVCTVLLFWCACLLAALAVPPVLLVLTTSGTKTHAKLTVLYT